MSSLGEPAESGFGRILRYFACFLFGALLGLLPAILVVAARNLKGMFELTQRA